MKSGSLVPRLPLVAVLVALVMLASGCVSPSQTPAQKRQGIIEMKNEVLEDLYRIKPDVRAQMAKASGYGVFSNAKIHWLLASVGGGYGMVVDNSTGRATYMKMGELASTTSSRKAGYSAAMPMPLPRPAVRVPRWVLRKLPAMSPSTSSPRAAWPCRPRSRAPSSGSIRALIEITPVL